MAKPVTNPSYDSVQGGRFYQEDRFVIHCHRGILMAVADGHRDSSVSSWCKTMLSKHFREHYSGKDASVALQEVFASLHQETRSNDGGSTLSTVFITPDKQKVFVGTLGDSPVVIRDKSGLVVVSAEHNARTNPAELEAAKLKGARFDGFYIYPPGLDHGLQLTRALGDADFDTVLNREPEVRSAELGKNSFVLVASDGLIDPAHEDTAEQIDRLVGLIDKGATAKDLVQDALNRNTGDNATAILWRY